MAKTLKEDVFIGTDNSFTIKISDEEGSPLPLDTILRMKLWLGGACNYEIDSQTFASAFNWVTPVSGGIGDTEFNLGLPAETLNIPAGNYSSRWKIFTALSPNGIVVTDPSNANFRLKIKVLASCETV